MRHFSLFDTPDEQPIKKVADANQYWTLTFDEPSFLGLFDLVTFMERQNLLDSEDADWIFDTLDYIYNGDMNESGQFVLRMNGDQHEIFRNMFYNLSKMKEDPESFMQMIDQNEDLSFEDIQKAENVFVETTESEPSSEANLEDIPTRNVGPEEERPGLFEGWGFETNPTPDEPEDEVLGPSTPAAQAFATKTCPKCSGPTIPSEKEHHVRCPRCGWQGMLPPNLREDPEQLANLEQQFKIPSVEHPLGPHTGADWSNNEYYIIPIDTSGNQALAVSIFLEWGDTYNVIPQGFMESDILSKDDQGNVVFSLTGEGYQTIYNLCQVFLNYAQQDMDRLIQSIVALDTMGLIVSQVGLDYNTDPEGVNNMVVELIKEITHFIIKFSNTKPSPSSQAGLEDAFNAPPIEHPLGPHTGNTQELYTSGGFVKGPDGRWLVAVNPAGGQRDPEPGDWATIQQRTKSFNRPVPVTLVEDMGGAWKFKNGHHPSIESQVEDEAI